MKQYATHISIFVPQRSFHFEKIYSFKRAIFAVNIGKAFNIDELQKPIKGRLQIALVKQ